MFENLRDRLSDVFKLMAGKGALREEDVDAALRGVRVALLEADVNFKVVREFVRRVKEAAVGQEVWKSLTPDQQVIQIVHGELVRLLGGQHHELAPASKPPTVILLCGLQGTGKTTHAGKLALYLKKRGRQPLLVAADLQRPAAVKQLHVVGEGIGVPVFSRDTKDAVEVVDAALAQAKAMGNDFVLLDTAGRLHIDEALMDELRRVRDVTQPHYTVLVVDAMTGQEAVNVADQFHNALSIDGIVLTKMDGDARGGAALSATSVTGRPILFIGTGEKMDALEPFHPDRVASRILGMGDVLTLIEKAQEAITAERAAELERKLRKADFTLEDFRQQIGEMRKMGPLQGLIDMIPGLSKVKGIREEMDETQVDRVEAIINSMTPGERRDPSVLNSSRKRRVARGSGTSVQDVNRLLKQFDETKRMMKQLESAGRRMRKSGGFPFPGGPG
ncbi:MAG: signal recognition particle protein [Armatimonadetes bacterium]|nr:signal recognition particle protein [Armatimonadota bacterium]